jgi:hypothetical protein
VVTSWFGDLVIRDPDLSIWQFRDSGLGIRPGIRAVAANPQISKSSNPESKSPNHEITKSPHPLTNG